VPYTSLEKLRNGATARVTWGDDLSKDEPDSIDPLPQSGKWSVYLTAKGNPDFGQYAPIGPALTVHADTFDGLKALAEEYKECHNLGGGNFGQPVVKRNGKKVGNLAWNGRLFESAQSLNVVDTSEFDTV
jgi:hypothetical protein